MSKLLQRALLGAGLVTAAGLSAAVGPDFSGITGAVDVSTVGIAIIAMGAVKIVPNVARWATGKLVAFFR